MLNNLAIKLEEWQKKWLEEKFYPISVKNSKKEGKLFMQAYDLLKFMKDADIGKSIAIVSPKGTKIWERIK